MGETVQSLDDFLRVLRKSDLVPVEQLAKAIEPWKGTEGPVPSGLLEVLVDEKLLTAWQIEQLQKGKHKGYWLGKYKLLRLLGAGGMSSVYLAENTTLHQTVAIKVLPLKNVDKTSHLARFEREAQASARLSHPNIARAFDLDNVDTIHFIVMEHIDGVDLHVKVKQDGTLSVSDAVDYIRQAALGLQYAHEEGLVHRDIKPANLILVVDKRGRGTVKILDLGLALAAGDDDEASLTRAHDEKTLGTVDYLAPEQARDSHLADARSDIYSLGCTLYYLLVGTAPFAAKKTMAERIRAHMNEPPPDLLEMCPGVPAAIGSLYLRMVEKHPDARPQSAGEIADALSAWLQTSAGTVQAATPERRPVQRRSAPGNSNANLLGSSGSMTRPPSSSGPVIRSGSGGGSGSSVRPGGSPDKGQSDSVAPTDLSSLSFTPPPSSGSRSTQKMMGVNDKERLRRAGRTSGQKTRPTERQNDSLPGSSLTGQLSLLLQRLQKLSQLKPLGLPLGFWLVVVIGLVLVVYLGLKVFKVKGF
ncbi:MAG: serine/threonine protein kinase [Planctomycetota bacterium]|nr:MAG: serine/threonine protein kinase [Planctomycetota bacterium]